MLLPFPVVQEDTCSNPQDLSYLPRRIPARLPGRGHAIGKVPFQETLAPESRGSPVPVPVAEQLYEQSHLGDHLRTGQPELGEAAVHPQGSGHLGGERPQGFVWDEQA